jgi:ABC-type sugar transport system permease subunit
MQVTGLVAGVIELIVGVPLAFVTAQQLGRFSLFALAPIACLALIVILVWPGLWQRLTGTADQAAKFGRTASAEHAA